MLGFFKRGESADEALQAVAAHNGWTATAASGVAMLPPSHAAAGMHGLEQRNPPPCSGRAFAFQLGAAGRAATLSHLCVVQSDDEESVYDMVTWRRPAGTVPRFELELGASAWGHHRLSDRFGHTACTTHALPGDAVLRLARDVDAAHAQAWCAAPGWAVLMALAHPPGGLRGCVAEGLGDRLAVFTWAGVAGKGQQRWRDLVQVAAALEAHIATVG